MFRARGRIGDQRHAIVSKERRQLARIVTAVNGQHRVVALPRPVLHVHVADQDESQRARRSRARDRRAAPAGARPCRVRQRPARRSSPRRHRGARADVPPDGRRCAHRRPRCPPTASPTPPGAPCGMTSIGSPRIVLRQRRRGPLRGREQEGRSRDQRGMRGAPCDDVDVRERRLRREAARTERWVGLRAAIHPVDAEEQDRRTREIEIVDRVGIRDIERRERLHRARHGCR